MKTSTILSAVLALQLLLAAGIGWSRHAGDGRNQQSALLDFDIARVDRVEISDNADLARVAKTGDGWVLPDTHTLAVNASRIDTLLDNLADLQTAWPVADTRGSIERLEVGEDNYQRRLRLYQGDALLGEYFFGTSPGFRQTHARRAGEDEVYALAINNFDMPADVNDWLDKTLLSVDGATRISGPDYMLTDEEDIWRLDHVENGEEVLDQDKVNTLVSALAGLRVMRVADTLPETEAVTVTVGDQERNWTYHFYNEEESYYVRRDDIDAGFTISKTAFDRIAGTTRDDLLQEAEDAGADAATGDGEAAV